MTVRAQPPVIILFSSGPEMRSRALRCVLDTHCNESVHMVKSVVEHYSSLYVCCALMWNGFETVHWPCGATG